MAAIKSSGDGTLSPAPLSPSICLPSCPSRCPPRPIVSPRRRSPRSRICAGTRPKSMLAVWGGGVPAAPPPAADVHHLRPGLLRFPGRTLSLSLRRTYRPTHRRFITSSLTRRNFPPALAISSVSRVQLHSSSAGRGVFFPPPLPLFLSALFGMWKPSSDDAIFHAPL